MEGASPDKESNAKAETATQKSAAQKKKDTATGILFLLLSAFCFALMNLFIRLAGDVPTMQKCFFRNFFALIIAVGMLIRTHTPFKPGKGNIRYLLIRSVSGGLGMICNFYAIDHMDISDASILNKLSPFFAVFFSIFVMKERANLKELAAILLAFIGALFVVKPSFSPEVIPALAGVLGGLGAGLAYAYVRKLGSRGEKSMIIVAFFSGFTSLLLLPNLIFHYTPMDLRAWIFLILTGCAAAGGQIFITGAYTRAPAKEISVFDYSIVLFTAFFGFVFLDQIPDLFSVIGYVIIILTAIGKWYFTAFRPARG